jgi:hypothetical protein
VLSVTHGVAGTLGLAYTRVLVSLAFQGEGSRLYSDGEHGALSSCVFWEAGLSTEYQVMEPGVMWRLQRWWIGSVEL